MRNISVMYILCACINLCCCDGLLITYASKIFFIHSCYKIACRDLIARVNDGAIDEAMLEDTAARIARLRTSAEGQEGLSAFLEKRTPNWM